MSCQFFLVRKRRQCRLLAAGSSKFCVHHMPESEYSSTKRTTCPFNTEHTAFISKLAKHMRVCPNNPANSSVSLEPINSVSNGLATSNELPSLRLIIPEVHAFIKKLMIIAKELDLFKYLNDENYTSSAPNRIDLSDVDFNSNVDSEQHSVRKGPPKDVNCETASSPPAYRGAERHTYQNLRLVDVLRNSGLLSTDFTYVEFGAGRGGFSHLVDEALSGDNLPYSQGQKRAEFILIDRRGSRHKFDTKHKEKGNFTRIRMDIACLNIRELPMFQSENRTIVGLAKHLCGDATDLALRCIKNSQSVPSGIRFQGILFALCCHHRCTWEESAGRPWFESDLNLTKAEFQIATRLSSWATCGFTREKHTLDEEPRHDDDTPETVEDSSSFFNLTNHQRTVIGRLCKLLIDWGRLRYLETELGFTNAKLAEYVASSVTLENMILLAMDRPQENNATVH